jgi:hypothetical protein
LKKSRRSLTNYRARTTQRRNKRYSLLIKGVGMFMSLRLFCEVIMLFIGLQKMLGRVGLALMKLAMFEFIIVVVIELNIFI